MTGTAALRLAAIAVLLLAACATNSLVEVEPETPLVWPGPPETARIAYIKSFRQPEDLGITRNFLQRLADVLFGMPQVEMVRPMAVVAIGHVLSFK